tara:strand:+ start:227 stop:535 length:309 start_codon:yes stop_codon:yes gene_type:complete
METVSVELLKWLLVGAGVAISAEAAFIAKLILSQRKELSDELSTARAQWKTLSDEELERMQNQLNRAQEEKLGVIQERDRIQNEYIDTLKRLRDNGDGSHSN